MKLAFEIMNPGFTSLLCFLLTVQCRAGCLTRICFHIVYLLAKIELVFSYRLFAHSRCSISVMTKAMEVFEMTTDCL